jgi:hypothetical protein
MNAKTTKFLAVLAVLAVAFAGVAVLVQEQSSDAAAGEAVTKDTYDNAIEAKVFTSIKLEDVADVKSVVLYQNKVGTTPATTIEAGMAYFFAADATGANKVSMPTDLTLDKPVMFFILDGVTVEVNPGKLADGAYAMIQAVCVKEYDAEAGIIVPAEQKYYDNKADPAVNTLFSAVGYAYNADGEAIPALIYDAADRIWTYNNDGTGADAKACKGFKIIADMTYDRNFILASLDGVADLYSDAVISKEIKTANMMKEITVTLVDFTGTLVYGTNTITLNGFTGEVKSVEKIITPKGVFAGLEIVSCEAGTVDGTAAGGLFVLDAGVSLAFEENATLGGAFGYVDEYNDMHFAEGTVPMTVGMDGLTIYAGNYLLGFNGTLVLTAAEDLTFAGNVTISGMIYTEGKALSIKKYNAEATATVPAAVDTADVKFAGLQVVGDGAVTLDASVLVIKDTSFYVKGGLNVNYILKIADGAVVKAEGAFNMKAGATAGSNAIWNSGQFIVSGYSEDATAGISEDKFVRVYMNSVDDYGDFYQGSIKYPRSDYLPRAYGAYIDVTGKCSVNLTAKNITVENNLYRDWTMILATDNTTIPLTVDYPNQYRSTVSLDAKDYASVESTAKSATFRGVAWNSADDAWIYVTAPEVYKVILAEALADDPIVTNYFEGYVPADGKVWTDGLTVKDQNGRVIPIADDGTIQVVFGYVYTIEGATSTSNYKFMSPNGDLEDLTKVSKTKGTFTMIRNNVSKINLDDDTPDEGLVEAPVVLYITEGFATTLTVYLEDDDKNYSVGDVFMYYAVADEKGKAIGDGTPVVLQLDDNNNKVGIIRGIYSNDAILFKSEFVKFYKSTAIGENSKKIVFPEQEEVVDPTTGDPYNPPVYANVDEDLYSEKWSAEFTFEQPDTGKTSVSASFTLKCQLNTVSVTFIFGQDPANPLDANQKIIVNFTDYCSKSKHTETVTTKLSDTTGTGVQNSGQFTITMTVGEVYEVTWTEIDGYLSTMTYDDNTVTPAKDDATYVMGTAVTVDGYVDSDNVTHTRVYTLNEEKLIYITIENQTDADLKVTIGAFSAEIAKKKSNDKVIVNQEDNTLVLSKKGYTVEGWDFTISYVTGHTPAETKTVYVSGPQTTETYRTYNEATDGKNVTQQSNIVKITITKASMEKTRYFVNVLADDHGAIDPFDQTGYMGEERKAYVTTQYGYNVVDVIYQYQEVDDPEIVEGHATKGTTPEGQEVWTYTMPASNVLLKPIIEKETRDLSFVDQNGELLAPVEKVAPRTEVFMPVPCWPLSEIIDVTTEAEIDFVYDEETGYITFVMPDEDVVFVVTCEEIDYSKNVLVTIGQRGAAIALVITALDGKMIASGSITMYVNYTYEEDGEVWTDAVEVAVEYESDGHSHGVILDETFIEELGEYYDGAFAVTGSFEFGYAAGEMSKTVYTPVLGA